MHFGDAPTRIRHYIRRLMRFVSSEAHLKGDDTVTAAAASGRPWLDHRVNVGGGSWR